MRTAPVAIVPTHVQSVRSLGADVGYSYVAPSAFVPPAPPVNTVGTPSSPQFTAQYGVPRATPATPFKSPFSTSGGNLGRPIATPAHPVARFTGFLSNGLFS